jgi:hypothetical protein
MASAQPEEFSMPKPGWMYRGEQGLYRNKYRVYFTELSGENEGW